MNNFSSTSNFIWSIADLIKDTFKKSKVQDVILPFTVLRRIDMVLEPSKEEVLKAYKTLEGRMQNLDPQLRLASGYAFYNTSLYSFNTLLDDDSDLAENLNQYINSFSENMRVVLEKFDFYNTIKKLDEGNLLYLVMRKFNEADLHPDTISNEEMGYIFEDLIRRFNESLNENPGEHFTPREVIRLMTNLILSQDADILQHNHIIRKVYDPCVGSGGMLIAAKDRIEELNPVAEVYLYGQEVNPETFALCKSDLYLKSRDGKDAENIMLGSTLSDDKHASERFDYLLANPPYGKDWEVDMKAVKAEADMGHAGRFGAGLPSKSDGQLLFLQHMINRMKTPLQGGSRIAIVMNSSPLFSGDAASGESEIRRWILENDWLETIIALPEQLFYNTSIATYVWVLTNRKETQRKGKVQLINAQDTWQLMSKSLGKKRRKFSEDQIEEITNLYFDFVETEISKIFNSTEFGFRKIQVERPLQLNFQASPTRLAKLEQQTAFLNLAKSKKRNSAEKAAAEEIGQKQQAALLEALSAMPKKIFLDRNEFLQAVEAACQQASPSLQLPKLTTSLKKAIWVALSERDESAAICRKRNGDPEPDTKLRDHERVPLGEDIQAYFKREVLPHVPDAWIDCKYTDKTDNQIGNVGYEINFNRYFYTYEPPRPLGEIETEIGQLEKEILEMLEAITE